MPNIEQQQQTKSNFWCYSCFVFALPVQYLVSVGFCLSLVLNIWYCSWFLLVPIVQTNKNQLHHQIFNTKDKQKPTIIQNIEQEEQTKTNYNTKY
jgi:hypothetical protein